MAIGSGFGGLVTALLPLVGLVTILRARTVRKRGGPTVDEDFEARQAATRESERRMAAYLAKSRSGGYHALSDDDEENRR
jgi:hypothetical protein